jgi:hypothetical protein
LREQFQLRRGASCCLPAAAVASAAERFSRRKPTVAYQGDFHLRLGAACCLPAAAVTSTPACMPLLLISCRTHFSHRKPAVAYQGSAFLMGYYAGVTQALLEAKPAVLVSLVKR